MKATIITSALFWLCLSLAWSQPLPGEADNNQASMEEKCREYMATIQESDLQKHLNILASDEYGGRETGTEGQKMAAEYIANHFKSLGLIGPVKDGKNPYFQSFDLSKSNWETLEIANGKTTFKGFEDFFPYGNFSFSENVELVFVGYGIDDDKYSDYKGIDVTGKGVVFLAGEPKNAQGNYLISGNDQKSSASQPNTKIKTANEKGAIMAISLYETDAEFTQKNGMYKGYLSRPSIDFKADEQAKFAYVLSSPTNGAKILGTTTKKIEKLMAKITEKGQPQSGKIKASVKANLIKKQEPVGTENVLGFLEGTDLKDEILVVTSHYDHIGTINGQVNNGADDDGSGTVGVLEIAEAFVEASMHGNRPRRSILFMTVTGEEKGLLGSEYYSNNPVFPLEQTITNLNIDMIGRVDPDHAEKRDFVYIIGSTMLSTDLHNLHEATAKKYKPNLIMDYKYNTKESPERFYYRSDHYNFAKHGIPVIFYFNGTHEDYHRPTDTVDKIQFDLLKERAQLVFATAWELANTDKRPVVDKSDK